MIDRVVTHGLFLRLLQWQAHLIDAVLRMLSPSAIATLVDSTAHPLRHRGTAV